MSPVGVIIALPPCIVHVMLPFIGGVHTMVSPVVATAVKGCKLLPPAMRTAAAREGTSGALTASGMFMRTRDRRDIYRCVQKKNRW